MQVTRMGHHLQGPQEDQYQEEGPYEDNGAAAQEEEERKALELQLEARRYELEDVLGQTDYVMETGCACRLCAGECAQGDQLNLQSAM